MPTLTIEDVLERFYDRDGEADFVKEMLSSREHAERIINFSGFAGSGKSWLLRWLFHKYQAKIPCCLLTAEEIINSSTFKKEELFRKVIEDFSRQSGYRADSLDFSGRNGMQKFANELENFLTYMHSRGNILLLIDDYDAFPSALMSPVESLLLSKLVESSCVLVVLNSQDELMFEHQQNLRLHTDYRELTPFDYESVSGHYQDYLELIPRILHITAGLPICVENMIAALRQHNVTTESEFLKNERQFVRINYERPMSKQVLANIAPEMHEVICALSIPWRFNVGIMRALLPTVIPGRFDEYTDLDYLDLINSLGYLSRWNPACNGYAIHQTIQRILSYYMALLDLDRFSEINDKLLAIYQAQIETGPFEVHHFVELLYHRLMSIRLSHRETAQTEIKQAFSVCLKELFAVCLDKSTSLDDPNSLKEMLEVDKDMRDFLTGEIKQWMESAVRSFNQPPVSSGERKG